MNETTSEPAPLTDNDIPLAPGPDAGAQITDAAKLACEQIEQAIQLFRAYQNKITSDGITLATETTEYTTQARKIIAIFSGLANPNGKTET